MNKDEEFNTIVARLISTLSNKLRSDRLEPKELAITTLKIDEQVGAIDSVSSIKSLTQVLSL